MKLSRYIYQLGFVSVLISGFGFISQAKASTFVGNGGTTSNIEYQVAYKQTLEALNLIITQSEDPKQTLCECNPTFAGHAICEILNSLTSQQRNYCQKFLQDNSQNLRTALLQSQIIWTDESMSVQESGGLRSAEAVTDASNNRITISQNKFFEMKSYERVFLLTHELGHTLKPEGKYLVDEQKIGPFQTSDGGRQLLNAIGAAVAMDAYDNSVLEKYDSILNRSKSRSKNFISVFSQGLGLRSNDTYAIERAAGGGFRYTYYFAGESFGVFAGAESSKGTRTILTQTKVSQERSDFDAGISYRFFSHADPLTFLGQSFGNIILGYESSSHTYSADDGFVTSNGQKKASQAFAELGYHLPMIHGFWIDIVIGARADNYEIEIPNRNIAYKTTTYSNIGVSYGF